MDYDKIKESEGYKRKKKYRDGHDIPMEDIIFTIENPSSKKQQADGRIVYWSKPDGYNHSIRTIVSATASVTATGLITKLFRVVTSFIDSGKKDK
jgi:hypothetical protein